MSDLSGRVALVTGAGSGIGRAIALRLASDGAHIAVNDVVPERAEQVARLIRDIGRQALSSTADVTDEDAVEDMMHGVASDFGRLDILVSNAGIIGTGRVVETSLEDFERVMAVNVNGTFLCGREAAKQMIIQGSGKIINASSVAGRRPTPFHAAYGASKYAVISLTLTMARELAAHGITVNAYCPGVVETPMWEQIDRERSPLMGLGASGALREITDTIPLGRPAKPEEVASLVSFLASADSDYITGQCINVCGGILMF